VRVTTKGQVTIPQHIRRRLGIKPHSEVDFVAEGERVYIVKKQSQDPENGPFRRLRGAATVKMSTDEIMRLTRGDR
jgi:AbrB family looped-hinge helix DNA binding protein